MPLPENFTAQLEDVLRKKQQRMALEENTPGLVQVQDEESEYYIQHKLNTEELEMDRRNEHQIDTKMSSVYAAVKQIMPQAYTNIEAVRTAPIEDMRKTKLHNSRGKKLTQDGTNVLEFDIAGSGFKQFRTEHKGFKGKDTYKFDGQDVKLQKESKVRWYHKSKLTNWIPGVRAEEQILRDNERIRQQNAIINQRIDEQYGQAQIVGDKELKHVRKKVEGNKTRISMAGPISWGGARNAGDYSIENLRQYMQTMAQEYLTNIFSSWTEKEDYHDINIIIKGHSRGAVASAEGAMMIKQWVHENFPWFEKYVKFELTQYDPVAGTGSQSGANKEFDHTKNETITEGNDKMRALGDSAETTVMYSMHTDHTLFFDPQAVAGAKRVILTPFKHGVGLGDIDDSKIKEKDGEREQQQHRPGYTDAKTGSVYRGSGINELPEGVYIVDEQNTLIRFETYEDAEKVVKAVLKGTWFQGTRHETVLSMAKIWFEKEKHKKLLQSYTQEFGDMHEQLDGVRKERETHEKIADAEALFSQLTDEQAVSQEALRALHDSDTAKLLKIISPSTDTNSELPELFEAGRNGYTDQKHNRVIRERLKDSNPLSRLLLQRTQGKMRNFVDGDGFYNPAGKFISIDKNEDLNEVRGSENVLFHEMGHMTDHIRLNQIRMPERLKSNIDLVDSIIEGEKQYMSAELILEYDDLKRIKDTIPIEEYIAKQKEFANKISLPIPEDLTDINKMSYENSDLSTAPVLGGKFHQAMENDYNNYLNKFIKVAYGNEKNEEAEEKVNSAIKNRLYWDIVARAQYADENALNMKMYGGSLDGAIKMAATEFDNISSEKSLAQKRKWLQDHDPLHKVKGQVQRYMVAGGVSDIFGSFAKVAPANDVEAKIVKDIMIYGHDKKYWQESESMVEVQNKDGVKVQVQGARMNECWAEMTALNFGGSSETEMFYREFMPESYAVFKEIRRDAVIGKSE